MKLVGYEIMKLIKKRLLQVLLVSLLMASAFLYYTEQRETEYISEYVRDISAVISDMNGMSPEAAAGYLTARAEEIYVRQALIYAEGDSAYSDTEVDYLKEIYPDAVERVMNSDEDYTESQLRALSVAYDYLQSQAEYFAAYPVFLESINENAENMLRFPVFAEKGSFEYRNILKTAADYEHIDSVDMDFGISEGISSVTSFNMTDLCIIILSFAMCYYLFAYEHVNGLMSLIRSCSRGRYCTFWGKLAALCISIVIMSGIFYGLEFTLSSIMYGYGNTDRLIQTMSAYRDSCVLISVRDYLITSAVIKTAVQICIGLFFTFVFTLMKSKMSAIYFISLAGLAGSWFLYRVVPSNFIFNHFKYINLFYYLDVNAIFSQYRNINFFTFPVNTLKLMPWFLFVICGVFSILGLFTYVKSKNTSRNGLLSRTWDKISIVWRRQSKSVSVVLHEGYKAIVMGGAFVVILAVGLYGGVRSTQAQSIGIAQEDIPYKVYISALAGATTEDKDKYIQNEYTRVDELLLELKSLDDKVLTEDELYMEQTMLSQELSSRQRGLAAIEADRQYLTELKKAQGIDGYYLDQITAREYFEYDEQWIINGVFGTVLCMLFIPRIFCTDSKNDTIKLLSTTKHGRKKLICAKYMWSIVLAVAAYVLVYIPYYIILVKQSGTLPLDAPLQSIQIFQQYTGRLTVGQYLILINFFHVLGLITASGIMLLVAGAVKNLLTSAVISTVVFLFPLAIQAAGVDLKYFTLNGLFLPSMLFAEAGGYGQYIYTVVICLICAAGYLLATPAYFRRMKIK